MLGKGHFWHVPDRREKGGGVLTESSSPDNGGREESFGEYLKRIREAGGLSIPELARRSGVSTPHISRVESGWRSTPKPAIIEKLALALRVPAEEMLRKAGYGSLAAAIAGQDPRARVFLRASADLTQAQLDEILEYIEFRKRQWARERREADREGGESGAPDSTR